MPHRCPLYVHYFLINPLRRLVESPRKLAGPYVRPGMTVLDVGCGFGFLTLPLARMVGDAGRVLAVDVEPRAVEKLEKRARRAGLSQRIRASVCQSADLGLAGFEGQVDLITAIHVLHEFEDLAGFASQAVRLLKPDGRMLVVEPKGHLKAGQFAAELECCRQAGLAVLKRPAVGSRALSALLGC